MNQRRIPKSAAQKVLKDLNISDLSGISLKDVVQHFGPYVKEAPMKGAQGRILFVEPISIITINSNIRSVQQARFVLAHEFGHYELHSNIEPLFNCNEDSFKQWLKNGFQEQEANEFAAELLMPSKVFKNLCLSQVFSLDLISFLAKRFETSLTATAIKLAEQGPFSIALIYSEDNIVKWHTEHSSFPLKYIIIGTETPPESAARRYFNTENSKSKVVKMNVWYFFDNNVDRYKNNTVREYCFPIPYYRGVLSLLVLE